MYFNCQFTHQCPLLHSKLFESGDSGTFVQDYSLNKITGVKPEYTLKGLMLSKLWELVWTGNPGMLQPMGSQRVGCDLATEQQQPGLTHSGHSINT